MPDIVGQRRASPGRLRFMLSGSTPTTAATPEQLLERFVKGSPRQRRPLIKTIEAKASDLVGLGRAVLDPFDPSGCDWAAGWVLQVLHRHDADHVRTLLGASSSGWLQVESAAGIDFADLQDFLLQEDFEEADRRTSAILRELAGPAAVRRGYVYFSEVPPMSGLDLVSLDRLWTVYSQGRFGFSIQARLLKGLDADYVKLWPRIGWKLDGVWTRYPGAFTWSLEAPEGHMPLINQLRGVRLMDSLLKHPALVRHRDEAGLS